MQIVKAGGGGSDTNAANDGDPLRRENELLRARNDELVRDLRRVEARFHAAIENSAEVISLTAADGSTRDLTPSAWRLLGWTAEEMGTRTFRDQVVPEDRDRLTCELARLVSSGARDMSMELRVHHRDGSIRWIESTATNLLDDPDVCAIVGNFRDISARKLAEAGLQESRHSLEEAQAIARVGSWTIDLAPDAKIQWSRECCRIIGVRDGTPMTVATLLTFVCAEDRERVELELRAALDDGPRANIEHCVRRADGSVRYVNLRAVVERDAAGTAIRLVGTLQDITERHAAIAALRASEEQYRRIVENTSEGVWLYDAAGITTFTNKRMATMLGYTVEETIGLPVYRFQDPSDRASAEARVARRRSGIAERTEARFRCKDGGQVWASLQSNPIFDDTGVFEAGLVLVTDISMQRRADETRARLAAIVESSEDAIMSVNLDGALTSWNLGAQTLYQYRAEEIVGQSLLKLLPTASRDIEVSGLERVTHGAHARHYESAHVRKDGSLIEVAVTLSPVRGKDGTVIGVSTISQDLTLRRQAEAVHRRTEEQYRQAQKMEAVGRLAGGIAHDFNNLLSVILSYAQFAIDDLKVGDPLLADMNEVLQAGKRAADLTKQLLAFSRQQILQPQVIDLNQIVIAMDRMLRRVLGEDVVLTLLAAPMLGRIYADPGQIEQVVMNLAVNARDAMPNGGSLSIETSEVHIDASSAVAAGVAPGDYILLAVGDTGYGMDAATQARIFEPFFTTKDQGKGTGLGLATVFGIVQQSDGHVRVSSAPGVGSTFKIYLPPTRRAPTEAHVLTEPLLLRGTETILLVEDEDQVRAVMCTILRRNGYHVLDSSNGGEAFLISKDFPAQIHMMLTDVVMPRMSGRKLAEELASQRPAMKVLFASGYTDDAIVHHGVLDAGVAFIQKPFTPDALLRKVRAVLDSPRLHGATVAP